MLSFRIVVAPWRRAPFISASEHSLSISSMMVSGFTLRTATFALDMLHSPPGSIGFGDPGYAKRNAHPQGRKPRCTGVSHRWSRRGGTEVRRAPRVDLPVPEGVADPQELVVLRDAIGSRG